MVVERTASLKGKLFDLDLDSSTFDLHWISILIDSLWITLSLLLACGLVLKHQENVFAV